MCPPPPCFFKRNDVLRNTNGVIINQLRSCFLLLVLWTTMPADSLQREMERERAQEQRQGRQGRQGRRANTALPLLLLSAVALLGLGLGLGPLGPLALLALLVLLVLLAHLALLVLLVLLVLLASSSSSSSESQFELSRSSLLLAPLAPPRCRSLQAPLLSLQAAKKCSSGAAAVPPCLQCTTSGCPKKSAPALRSRRKRIQPRETAASRPFLPRGGRGELMGPISH